MNDDINAEPEVTALLPVADGELAGVRARLARSADQQGLLDVAYRTIDTPVGPLLLAATERGLVRVAYEREGFPGVLEALAARLSPRVLEAPQRLDPVARELEEYFTGGRQKFDVPLVYVLSAGFRGVVQRYLPHIG